MIIEDDAHEFGFSRENMREAFNLFNIQNLGLPGDQFGTSNVSSCQFPCTGRGVARTSIWFEVAIQVSPACREAHGKFPRRVLRFYEAIEGVMDFEISATVFETLSGLSFSAKSACATIPITRSSPSTIGIRLT